MKVNFLDLHKQYLTIKSEIDASISSVISESAYIKGKYVSLFETKFSELNNSKHCVSVANGTDALYIALKSLGVKPGDEIIIPAQTWISTAECVLQLNAKPVFVDVDEYYSIDVSKIKHKISSKTKGIIAVHLFGQMCDLESINNICERHDLFLVEDCAQSHFSKYNDIFAGLHGDLGTFSFYPGKNLGAYGDAGAIITNNADLANYTRMFANHGGLKKHVHEMPGINSRMDGLQAAILLVKMNKIFQWTEDRNKISQKYSKELSKISQIKIPKIRSNSKHSFHQYVIKTPQRDELRIFLKKNGIDTLIHYPVSLPYIPIFNLHLKEKEYFPMAKKNQEECLSLPIYPELLNQEIDYIISIIKIFFEK